MKFNEIVNEWKLNKEPYVKRSTMSAYGLLLQNRLLPFFADRESISEDDLQKFVLEKLQKGLSNKSIKDSLIVLKMILRFGVKIKEWTEIPPFEEIKYPTEQKSKNIETLNPSDYRKAVLYVKEHFTFKNFGVLLVLSSGMRIGEICALKWSDFDLHEGTVTVQRTIQRIYTVDNGVKKTEIIIDNPKTKSSNRVIPLSADVLKIIKSLDKIINKEFYVLTNDEKPTEPRSYRSFYKELMQTVGLPLIKFHGLRHSFATQCIAAKVDVKTVSSLLGHSNISTTFNLYVHPSHEQKKSAINQLFKSIK